MGVIESLLIFTVTALDLTVVTRRVWTDQFMSNTQLFRSVLKQRRYVALAI